MYSYNHNRLSKLNQEDIKILNKTVSINIKIKDVTKNLAIKKSPCPDGLTAQFYKKFREEPMLLLLKLFGKTEREAIVSKSLI